MIVAASRLNIELTHNNQIAKHPVTISLRSQKISPSQTLSISALANHLNAQGKDVINLAVGQPNFPTPDHVKQAAIEAVQNNMTRYLSLIHISEPTRPY